MDILSVVLMALEAAVKAWPTIVSTEQSLEPFALALWKQLSGGGAPSDAEQEKLNAAITVLYANSQEPLPPAQPDDPDYVKP